MITEESPLSAGTALPTCTIRQTCRWFGQRGRDACVVCPLVVTDAGGGTETVKPPAAKGDPAPTEAPRSSELTSPGGGQGPALLYQ
jgi:hypothetical protein